MSRETSIIRKKYNAFSKKLQKQTTLLFNFNLVLFIFSVYYNTKINIASCARRVRVQVGYVSWCPSSRLIFVVEAHCIVIWDYGACNPLQVEEESKGCSNPNRQLTAGQLEVSL